MLTSGSTPRSWRPFAERLVGRAGSDDATRRDTLEDGQSGGVSERTEQGAGLGVCIQDSEDGGLDEPLDKRENTEVDGGRKKTALGPGRRALPLGVNAREVNSNHYDRCCLRLSVGLGPKKALVPLADCFDAPRHLATSDTALLLVG